MNPKARITYRFETVASSGGNQGGGGGRTVRRLVRVGPDGSRETPETRETYGFGPDGALHAEPEFRFDAAQWNSPFQDDTDALERLIRGTDRSTAEQDAGESAEQAGGTEGGEGREDRGEAAETADPGAVEPAFGPPEEEARFGNRPFEAAEGFPSESRLTAIGGAAGRYVPRRRPPAASWIRAAATVVGAVLTGALFGWLVMSLIFWQAGSPGPSDAGAQPGGPADQTPRAADETPEADPAGTEGASYAAGSRASVGIPAVRYHMIQYGAFSTEAGLKEALAQLESAGFPSGADTGDGYRAYAGIADSREGAEALAGTFGGVELYIRPLDIPSVPPEAFAGQPEAVPAFLLRTAELIRTAGGLSASLLAAGGTSPVPEEAWSDWEASHRSWKEAAEALADAAAADGFRAILGAVGRAADAFAAYRGKADPAHLKAVQSALIEAAVALRDRALAYGAL